jgi:hypothetical protein
MHGDPDVAKIPELEEKVDYSKQQKYINQICENYHQDHFV